MGCPPIGGTPQLLSPENDHFQASQCYSPMALPTPKLAPPPRERVENALLPCCPSTPLGPFFGPAWFHRAGPDFIADRPLEEGGSAARLELLAGKKKEGSRELAGPLLRGRGGVQLKKSPPPLTLRQGQCCCRPGRNRPALAWPPAWGSPPAHPHRAPARASAGAATPPGGGQPRTVLIARRIANKPIPPPPAPREVASLGNKSPGEGTLLWTVQREVSRVGPT